VKDSESESARTGKGTAIVGGNGDQIVPAIAPPVAPVTAHLLAPVIDATTTVIGDVLAHLDTVDDARVAVLYQETLALSIMTIIEFSPLLLLFLLIPPGF